MPRCREKLAELEYVVWDGKPETANAFFGEAYGLDWEYASPHSEAITFPGAAAPASVGDVLLKNGLGQFWQMKPLDFPQAYETIKAN